MRGKWQVGSLCLLILVNYDYSATLGPLDPGTHAIFVTEYHQSLRDPWPDDAVLVFDVSDYMLAVQNLTATVVGSDIILRWTVVEGATGYRIYRASDFAFEIEPSYLVDSTITPIYTDSDVFLLPYERFFYIVTATR